MGEGVDIFSFKVKFKGKTGNKGTAQGQVAVAAGLNADIRALQKAESAVRATFAPVPIDMVSATVRKLRPKKAKKK